jgi:rhodanese-related sulfurtransferase
LRFSFDRPSVEHPVFKFFFTFLSKHDSPFNQAPSLHVAYACLFWSVLGRQLKGWTRWVVGIWLLFMGIATLTVYQHHLVDVLTALILVHVGFVLFPSPSGLLHDSALSTLKAARLPFLSGTEKIKLDEKWKLDLEAEVCRRNQGIGNVYYAIGWCLLLLALWGGTHAFGLYLLCWPSLVCIAVGRNYVINNPRFLKNEKGWMPVFKKLVYSPYQWIYWLLWRFVRRRNNPPLLEILPRCYVGPRTTAGDLRVLGLNKHLVVFDLAAELEEITIRHVQENYQSFPLLDVAAITLADAEKILAALVIRYQQLQRDENMIIHCTMGYSRSMIFAVLLSQKILSLDLMDAIDLVKSHNKHLVLHKHALKLMEVLVERNS